MTKDQADGLRNVKSGVHIDKLNQRDRAVLLYLVDQKLAESRCDIGGDVFFLITEAGKQALSDWNKNVVHQIAAALAAVSTLLISLSGLLNQLGLLPVQAA